MIFQKRTKSASSATWKRYVFWGAIVGSLAMLATSAALVWAAPVASVGLMCAAILIGIVVPLACAEQTY